MQLTIQQYLHGFTVLSAENLPEIDGSAYSLLHEKSGAKLLYLDNDDNNKSFSIAFKTVPSDDTGVFHILEHSVLCGSDKFPVKEPFVNLLKSSMQTFLNAMTFPDKTMYPVASTNDKDLMNLVDVYMDAVLNPMIYSKRAIFEQEGWHFELGEHDETPESKASALTFNGVVYNEMKGALSDANSVLYDALQAALFPDTAYRFESGGIPHAIPTLTYEHYLEEHERHYRLDNSYLTLYGNLNLEAMLEFLDKNYLCPAAEKQALRDNERLNAGLEVLTPHKLDLQQPVKAMGVSQAMATSPENSCMGLGYIIGTAHERTRCVAVDILLDAIMGSNEAPLKRALLDARLASEAQGFLADSLLQPFAVIQLRDLEPDAPRRFRAVVEQNLCALAQGALDHKLIEASLSRAEFIMREQNFGMADGVALSMASLQGWLYNDSLATSYLHYEEDFAFLRKALEDDYFEQLISSVFLANQHMAEVEIIPTDEEDDTSEAARLARAASHLTEQDYHDISANEEILHHLQEDPDSPEALASLPSLSLADVGEAPQTKACELIDNTPIPCLRHDIATHGIAYTYRYFNMNHLSFEDLPYVALLGLVLSKLDTEKYSASEIDTLINGKLGNLSFFVEIHENEHDPYAFVPHFVVGASSLAENVDYLIHLPQEVLLNTLFTNTDKIKDVLQQCRVAMEHSFAAAGHSAALARLSSYYLPVGVAREEMSGVSFYRFLKNLLTNFDEEADDLAMRLINLSRRLFIDNASTLSFTGSEENFERFMHLGCTLERTGDTNSRLVIPAPRIQNEAFIVPSDVCYAAQGFDRRSGCFSYSGSWQVAAKALSYDYLWNEVRVKGGAYGAGFQTARSGNLRFYSYRDPHLDATLERFSQTASWLETFSPSNEEMEGYIVSTVAGFDKPVKARSLIRREDGDWFSGRTPESRAKTRSQMVGTTIEDINSLSAVISEAIKTDARCVFGSKEILEAAQTPFDTIDLFNE